ncbi:hypothetical protein FRC12_022131 [Ceratobasidium sp. 428]|nr:hypothetical protein FRC12_022131 [Ceratobasidium sp. 428]
MSSKESTRVKARRFLRDSRQAFRDILRPRSPAPSSSSAVQPDQGDPTPSTTESTSNVTESFPTDKLTVDGNATASTAILGKSSAGLPAPESTPTLEPSATRPLEKSDTSAPDNSTISLEQSSFVSPSARPTTKESPSPGAGQNLPSSQIATGVPYNSDVVTQAPELAQSSGPTVSGDQAKDATSAILKSSLSALGKCIGVVPTFKSVMDILADCIDKIPAAAKNHKDYEALAGDITNTIDSLRVHLSQANSAHMFESIEHVMGALTQVVDHVKEKQTRTAARTYAETEQDVDDLMSSYRRVDALLRQLQSDSILSIWRTTNESLAIANEALADARLEKLNPVRAASYDSSIASQLGRGSCTPNTRQAILEKLQDWASNPRSSKVYWMNGMAGTGKTTIAYSFCSSLEVSHQLAASFFCSRSLSECRDVSRIAPTIMYYLAHLCRPIKGVLSRLLGSDPTVGTRGIATQLEQLMRGPLQETKSLLPEGLPVVVIDALDECSSYDDASLFLGSLLRFAEDLPIKFFVACRPYGSLLNELSSGGRVSHSLLHLHNIENSLVQADIQTYLQTKLGPLPASAAQISKLTAQSGKLFIHAATVVRYVRLGNSAIDHQKRLDVILGMSPKSSGKQYKPLDVLYTTVLSSVLEDEDLESWDRENIEQLLYTVICAREPLSVESLTCLLMFENDSTTLRAIEPLRSVLHLDELTTLVSTLHASFPDYMLTAERSTLFFCNPGTHHELLSRRCFENMKGMLHFNICSFDTSYILDKDRPDLISRIDHSIPPHLFYACRYWSEHLGLAADSSMLSGLVSEFLRCQVLFWAEVMTLKQATRAGAMILADTSRWMKSKQLPPELHRVCQDAQKLMTVIGASPVSQCTPHIYLSVLAIWDRSEPMWMYYGMRMQKLVRATGTAIDNRESAGLAVWRYKDSVFTVAVSPDGRWVASGSYDHTVCIWDSHTGQIVAGPLVGHTDLIESVAFSPNNDRVASGSKDNTIRIWDSKTGKLAAGPFEGHTDSVRSVMFSPNGCHLASGSEDCTVRIWDTTNGQAMEHPCSGHTNWVLSVAYSPNGDFVASGSFDRSIRIWNAKNGVPYLSPLNGHSGSVCSVRYSPTGSSVVSGSNDHTVRIWDSHSGDLIAGPFEGHSDIVCSVAYSPDGTHIVSSSRDHTIRIWDAQTGQTVAGPLRGHTNWVNAAVYMPDGNRIVSGADDATIRIWDARARHTRSSLSDGHTAGVLSVAFSPDGSRIVSGSVDCTVCIWDAQTGARLVGPLEGHTSDVRSVAFSPSGDRVASASEDQTIRLWDAQTGSELTGPLVGDLGYVSSVAFSPSGRQLASGSDDCTVRVWDAQTGSPVGDSFRGHSNWALSVAYSRDGGRIVSGSGDNTLRVWDAQSGVTVAGPFSGHTKKVNSVSYSPDGSRILSGSDDHTIRIWDAETGHNILDPLSGHTDLVWSAVYSPDGHYIVSGSFDQTMRIWDAVTGDALTGPFRAHTHRVVSVTFSPDSQLIASSSHDSTIRVWDTQKCLATPQDSTYWTMNEDGWVVGHDSSLLFWVPADLRPMLKWPQNTVLVHQQGSFELDFTDTALGPRWTECWKSE